MTTLPSSTGLRDAARVAVFQTSGLTGDSDAEHSILEYARQHQLTQNYLSYPVLESLDFLPSLDDFIDPDIEELDDVAALLGKLRIPQSDKFRVDKTAADFLASTVGDLTADNTAGDVLQPFGNRSRNKLELPMLRTSHEMDLIDFEATTRRDSRLTNPPEWTDADPEQETERSQWLAPSSSYFDQVVSIEKLRVSREVMSYISSIFQSEGGDTFDMSDGWRQARVRGNCSYPRFISTRRPIYTDW
jgi:hypothetical protein